MNQITIIDVVSHALGDNIATVPYADKYQEKHGGKVYVRTVWHSIFESKNPNVEFVGKNFHIIDAKLVSVPYIFASTPIQHTVCNTLGLDYQELRPTLKPTPEFGSGKKKKYVCIGVQATAQMKYWNNNGGWDKVVRTVKKLGYDVYCIDKDEVFGVVTKWNHMPKGAINETGNYPIEYRIAQLRGAAFFIGLSSGLSWLAWAAKCPVIMISGCTNANNEFRCERIINTSVCHGCLNDPTIDHTNQIQTKWFYCPRDKKFECTKEIDFSMVKDSIMRLHNQQSTYV